MAKYDISRQALEDLYKIWEYTVDTWSETQADKYYELLEDALNIIGTDPQKIGKPYDEIMIGLKGYHVKKHMVFYIIQENGRAFVARILHEKVVTDYTYALNSLYHFWIIAYRPNQTCGLSPAGDYGHGLVSQPG